METLRWSVDAKALETFTTYRHLKRWNADMHEALKALQFYRMVRTALNTPGIGLLEVTRGLDGEIEVNVSNRKLEAKERKKRYDPCSVD